MEIVTPAVFKSNRNIKFIDPKDSDLMQITPKPRKPNIPVRNPTFREHEGLKALQKQLNTNTKN